MGRSVPCRIDGLIARDAPKAVLFRRSPGKYCEMLSWDLRTDDVTPGQWIRATVRTRLADLSPNGKYLIAAYSDHSIRRIRQSARYNLSEQVGGCWTAISKPPYFTALALWFSTSWNGGGIWDSDTQVGLNNASYGLWQPAMELTPTAQVKSGSEQQ